MKKGFTLIELLAVIVILAIIALIATPIILNIINDAKESALLRSAENYLSGVKLSVVNERVKNATFSIEDGTYSIQEDGDICLGNLIDSQCDSDILKVGVKNQKPNGQQIVFQNEEVKSAILKFGDKIIELNNGGNLEVVKSSEEKYEEAKKSGNFLGTIDKYVLEEKYGIPLGAEVNYEEPTSLGYDGTWRVLGVNEDGQVMLVSSNVIGTMELAGKDGFNNGVQKLDQMCSSYVNETTGIYARSIRAEDLNELIEYNPEKELDGDPYAAGKLHEYGVTATYKKTGDNTFDYTRVTLDGTKTTESVTFKNDTTYTGEFLDINSSEYLKLNESVTMKYYNNYYQYCVTMGGKTDAFTNDTYYCYTVDSTSRGNPSRAGYLDLFISKDSSGNPTISYWLANKSMLAHNGGAGWGMSWFNVYSASYGLITKETLYNSTKFGTKENGLGAGESSKTLGVRAVVYLSPDAYFKKTENGTYNIVSYEESKAEVLYESANSEKTDIYGNKITVPKGFKVLVDSTVGYTAEALDVTKGIVIEDKDGNEFVWVPTGTVKTSAGDKTITLDRYTFYASGTATKYKGTEHVQDEAEVKAFLDSVSTYGGYYMGRHEAKTNSNGKVSTSASDYIWHGVNGQTSKTLASSMYEENTSFATELMNSYAWDTALVFIHTFESDRAVPYPTQPSLNNKDNVGIALQGTNKLSAEYVDRARNIYDIASNCAEWTTETKDGVPVYRGSDFDYTGTTTYKFASKRSSGNISYIQFSFRPVLYLK